MRVERHEGALRQPVCEPIQPARRRRRGSGGSGGLVPGVVPGGTTRRGGGGWSVVPGGGWSKRLAGACTALMLLPYVERAT